MPKIIGENLDMLCNFQIRPGSGSLPRGDINKFYAAARKKQVDPLTYLAGSQMCERVHQNDVVLIVTGTRNDKHLPVGETDGHLGAASLARCVDLAFGGKSVITLEQCNYEPVAACVRAAGLNLREEKDLYDVDGAVHMDIWPQGPEAGKEHAKYLIDHYNPKAIVFMEKHGPNEKGFFHTVTGNRIDEKLIANTQYLLPIAKERGILTIGAGDGGNEIGNGKIFEEIHNIKECLYGSKCRCGCGGGIATVSETDVFLASAISNWGIYGMVAMIAFIKGNVDIMHDEDCEARMLIADVMAGAVDGETDRPIPAVDGIPLDGGQALVTLMREVVSNGLKTVQRKV